MNPDSHCRAHGLESGKESFYRNYHMARRDSGFYLSPNGKNVPERTIVGKELNPDPF